MSDDAYTKKSMGQHWLDDKASLQAMCEAANVRAGDVVLEIGPGTGTLTEALLQREAEVLALEFDERLIPNLKTKFSSYDSTKFSVEQGDIRSYDFTSLPDIYKLVANIPYYLSANLMRLLTDPPTHKPKQAALLMQKEVVERIAARPGDMAFLSVVTQFYYQVKAGQLVPAALFTPPPKVDSQILALRLRDRPLFTDVEVKLFFRLVKAGFSQRRKTLLNSLSSGLHLEKQAVTELCKIAHIDPRNRPQELSLDAWHDLYVAYTALLNT